MVAVDIATYPTRYFQDVDWDSDRWFGFDPASAIFISIPAINRHNLDLIDCRTAGFSIFRIYGPTHQVICLG